jgi:hypothetical protein
MKPPLVPGGTPPLPTLVKRYYVYARRTHLSSYQYNEEYMYQEEQQLVAESQNPFRAVKSRANDPGAFQWLSD